MVSDGTRRLLVFGIGPERFAVPLDAVDEVIDSPPVRRMPDAGPSVLGVTVVRGSLVTIYDPRPVLNVEGTAADAALLFVRDGRRVGMAVDTLYDPIVVEDGDMRSAPGVGDGVLLGVVRRGSDLIAILDAGALLDAAIGEDDEATQGDGKRP